ncbi:unnamed protein product [Polarella glacialis]|uniref:Uncharacterized protein n=1 Tax=Polarella glacialis TaxID=89957 RepID=A0A813FM19_POLGL|nr:unnamed protein product [Polarella glacialis]
MKNEDSWTHSSARFANALTKDLWPTSENPWLPSGCEVFTILSTDKIATESLKHLPPLSETSGPGRVVLVLNIEHLSGEEVWALLQQELRAQDRAVILGNKWNATHSNLEDGRVSSLWVPCASLLFIAYSKSTPMDLLSVPPSRAVYNTVAYQQRDCNHFREQVWDRLNEMLASEFQARVVQIRAGCGDLYINNDNIGYISENIIDALLAGTVQIYAGSLDISQMINPDRFILLKGGETDEEQLRLVMALVQDPVRYDAMRSKPAVVSDEAMRQFFSWIVTPSRVCDQACTSYHGFQASLDDVKSQCAKDSECAAVVDFTGNGGLIALCRKDTEYRAWSKVCVEKKAGDEL